MQHKHSILALVLLLVMALADPAAALRIRITEGAEGALPVAVVPFQVEGGAPPEDVAGIITNDLRRSGRFEPIPPADFLDRPHRLEQVNFANWRAIGADNLVIGNLRQVSGGQYELTYELIDAYRGTRLGGKRYKVSADSLRTLAHKISDEIYQTLIGKPGAFNTQLAYVSVEDTSDGRIHKLMLSDADGYRPQTILTSKAPLMSPAWSPDRRHLAYVSFEGQGSEIFVQTVATGERRKVASFEGINSAPSWAPDGRRLAFTSSKDGNPNIYVLDIGSGRVQQVTEHWSIDTEPTWTPDGEQLLFTSDRGGKPQIYRVPAGGGSAERISFEGDYNAHPDVSPDGEWLTMTHRRDGRFHIAVQNLQNGQVKVLTEGPLDESPTFAPNGDMIIYSRAEGGRSQLATVSLHGRADQVLRTAPVEMREPAWSPLP